MATIDLFNYSDKDPRLSAPRIEIKYVEKNTDNYWIIWTSVAEAKLYRIGDKLGTIDIWDRKHDADLMVRRLETSLLIGKQGCFRFGFDAMWNLNKITLDDNSEVYCNTRTTQTTDTNTDVLDWFGALSTHDLLRRAAEDAYMSAVLQQESIFFLYRGFEWLKKAVGNLSWDELGKALDIPQKNIDTIKKTAHDPDAASRHAVETGKKLRLTGASCSSWVCGLFHAIAHVRCKLDTDFNTKVEKEGNPWSI